MRVLLVAALLFPATALSLSGQASNAIQGVWQASQVQTTGPNAASYASQPSLYFFTGRHYSIVSVDSREPRPQFRDAAVPTATEAFAIWQPFTAQAGTFEVVGNELRTMATVAKNPHVMSSGRLPDVYRMSLQGETLTLVSVSGRLGPIPNPETVTLVRVR